MAESINIDLLVEEHSDALYKFALLRVQDRVSAEDLVQETFLASLKSKENFSSNSSVRTWLISILKHKIADFYRSKYKESERKTGHENLDADVSAFFSDSGHWKVKPEDWEELPDKELEKGEFWEILGACVKKLPDTSAGAFKMKIIDELETESICNILEISTTNLYVMVHRAKLLLRDCLEANWFRK